MSDILMSAFRANNSSNEILVCTASNTSPAWSANTYTGQSCQGQPCLAWWANQWWVAFNSNDTTNRLLLTCCSSGGTWQPFLAPGQNLLAGTSPALAATGTQLFVAFTGSNNNLQVCSLGIDNQST